MFHSYLKEGLIPLPDSVLKGLEAHCKKMMIRSDSDAAKDPFDRFLAEIDLVKDTKEPWIPEYLAPLYGTHFYNCQDDAQKLTLNHMGWVAHYQYSVLGELMTLQYNNACAALFRQQGHTFIADYLERESLEEEIHIKTFSIIGDWQETRILGRPMIRERLAQAYTLHPNGFRDFNGWTATAFYYWLRGHQNISLRAREQALQDVETSALIKHITAAHFRDETRHYATSHLVAELMAEVDVALPEQAKLEFICSRSFNGPQSGCSWIWPSVQATPGTLILETAALLANPIFKLSRSAQQDVLEEVHTHRIANPQWEYMRMRTIRNALKLNERVSWVPERFQDHLEETFRYNLDKGLPYARKAWLTYKKGLDAPAQASA